MYRSYTPSYNRTSDSIFAECMVSVCCPGVWWTVLVREWSSTQRNGRVIDCLAQEIMKGAEEWVCSSVKHEWADRRELLFSLGSMYDNGFKLQRLRNYTRADAKRSDIVLVNEHSQNNHVFVNTPRDIILMERGSMQSYASKVTLSLVWCEH